MYVLLLLFLKMKDEEKLLIMFQQLRELNVEVSLL